MKVVNSDFNAYRIFECIQSLLAYNIFHSHRSKTRAAILLDSSKMNDGKVNKPWQKDFLKPDCKTDGSSCPVLCEKCGLAWVFHNHSNEFDQAVLQDGSEILDGKVNKPWQKDFLKPDCKTDVQIHPVLCEKPRLEELS